MPKGWKQMTLPTLLLRRFRELKPQNMSDHEFLNKLLDSFMSKSSSQTVKAKHKTRHADLAKDLPCYSRFEDEGFYFCVTHKGHIRPLSTLKICGACLNRITQERAQKEELILKTRYYVTCGARPYPDPKKGLMLYCSKHFQGQWVTPQDCQNAKCGYVKEVQTT